MWEPDYITLLEYKNLASIPATDTKDDIPIGFAITAASRAIDKYCSSRPNGLGYRRQFGLTDEAEARYYSPRWDRELGRWVIEVDDFMTTEDLVIEVDTSGDDSYSQTVAVYVARPREAPLRHKPYTQIAVSASLTWIKDSARVTNRWGWSEIPDTIKEGTFLQASRFFKRRQAPFGSTGSPSKATVKQVLDKIDVDIEFMVQDYVRLGWTA